MLKTHVLLRNVRRFEERLQFIDSVENSVTVILRPRITEKKTYSVTAKCIWLIIGKKEFKLFTISLSETELVKIMPFSLTYNRVTSMS